MKDTRRILRIALLLPLAACTADRAVPAAETAAASVPAPVTAPVVALSVAMRAFQAPDTVAAGWTSLRFTNDTDEDVHYAHFVRLDSGRSVPELVDYYAKAIRESGPRPKWIVRFGGPGGAGPHQTASVTQKLEPGTYVWICPVENEKGEPHFGAGEYRTFVVREANAEGTAASGEPASSGTIRLTDHAYTPDSSLLRASRHAIRVQNDGTEPHDINIIKLAPGRTIDDVRRSLNPERARRPGEKDVPPLPLHELGNMMGGVAAMAPGMTAFFDAELTPGEYVLFCMVTAPDGRSHIEHGMIRQMRVQ